MSVNIRDFILETKEAEETAVHEEKKPTAPKCVYEVILNSNPDFIIRKKTAKTSTLFVCILSQNQFYFKNEKTNTIEQYSEQKLKTFLSNINEIFCIDDSWCSAITNSIAAVRAFSSFIHNETLRRFAQRGLIKVAFNETDEQMKLKGPYTEQSIELGIKVLSTLYSKEEIAEAVGALFTPKRFHGQLNKYLTINAMTLFEYLGIDQSRIYITEKERMPQLNQNGIYDYRFLFYPNSTVRHEHGEIIMEKGDSYRVFSPQQFIDYAIYGCIRQGFAKREDTFINLWKDTLSMQEELYGKIKDKYPESLATTHQIYTYKRILMEEQINEQKLAETIEKLKPYEWESGKYFIKCPKSKEDIIDEAVQQSNCLAGYTQQYIEGRSHLFFLRKKAEPERSLVTIEVRDGCLRQALRAYNHCMNDEEIKVVHDWCTHFGIQFF